MLEFLQQQGTLFVIGFSFVCLLGIWSLNRLQRSLPSPLNKLLIRWVRLVFISLVVGIYLKLFLLSGVPYWRLCLISLLLWALVDTLYVWLYIMAWDKSELPLFPRIKLVERVDWPANRRFFFIRDWIRQNNYQEIAGFTYTYEDEVLQRAILYESPDKTIRLQVFIVPDVTGVILDQLVFVSETESGERIITDNIFMPYGGVYPKDWTVRRRPLTREIDSLAKTHSNTIVSGEKTCIQMETAPFEWLQETQDLLEAENVKRGMLNASHDREDYGKMTGEGRYRIWKELLMLNYFGKSLV